MQQVSVFVDGERNYEKITGDTGPLVYPAIHLYIYRTLQLLTRGGTDILLAQCYFAILYLCNLGLVMACYRLAKVSLQFGEISFLEYRFHHLSEISLTITV